MSKFHLVLLIHAHQPVGNFDGVFEQVYRKSYLPFIEVLERHPSIRIGLHYSGPLLEWFEQRHPEFLDRLRELVALGQAEMVGGGFYEPILISIPPQDQQEQLQRMRWYLGQKFGHEPAGAWLAERVWEPQLPSILSTAEVQYTLVDDIHFLAAGFEQDQLYGYYVAEDCGRTVRLLPGLKALRYLLPFASVEDGINFLRDSASRHPGGMAIMGDDCEKFGAWPSTYEHVYRDGWLERFFTAVESSADWLVTSTPGECISSHEPQGRADLPTASYTEMMEWVLPTPARSEFHRIAQEFGSRPDALRFLRGGAWRGFFTKYAEANLLHKKMLKVSEHVQRAGARRVRKQSELDAARTHVLRAQCNDAYWHGVFGGLYAPHLRSALWSELVRAETLLAESSTPRGSDLQMEKRDFDADGADELYVTSRRMAALFRPADGGTLAALDSRRAGITLINSMQRRPEPYHNRLREASSIVPEHAVSIHEGGRALEDGLDRFLHYDRWPRNAFRLFLFSPEKRFEDYQSVHMEESAMLAGGMFSIRESSPTGLTFASEVSAPNGSSPGHGVESHSLLCCVKKFTFNPRGRGYEIACEIEILAAGSYSGPGKVGLEMVINLLAPNEADRYFEVGAAKHPLRWSGAVQASDLSDGRLRMVDEWQGVAVAIEAPDAGEFWIAPIETVSESEAGFERVYQGSQVLIVWPTGISAGAAWRAKTVLFIEPVHAAGPGYTD